MTRTRLTKAQLQDLPPGWWFRLVDMAQKKFQAPRKLDDALSLRNTGVSFTMWKRARETGRISKRLFESAAEKFKLSTSSLLVELAGPRPVDPNQQWLELLNADSIAFHKLGVLVSPEFGKSTFFKGLDKDTTFILADVVENARIANYRGVAATNVQIRSATEVNVIDSFPEIVKEQRTNIIAAHEAKIGEMVDGPDKCDAIEQHNKDLKPRKVHVGASQQMICDISGIYRLVGYRTDWYASLAVKEAGTLLHLKKSMLQGGEGLDYFPMRMDMSLIILSNDMPMKLLVGFRAPSVGYDANTWAVIGENLQWDEDADESGAISLEKAIVRTLSTDHDETTFAKADVLVATKHCIARATEWNKLLGNLFVVVKMQRSASHLRSSLHTVGEHTRWDWLPFELEPMLRWIVSGQYAKGDSPAMPIASFTKYAVWAALNHCFGRDEVNVCLEKILAENGQIR